MTGEVPEKYVSPVDLSAVAKQALADVAGDPEAPAAARVSAAVALLNLVGDAPGTGGRETPVGDMSLADIEAEIGRLRGLS